MPQYLIVEFTEESVFDIISSTWTEGRSVCNFPLVNAEEKMRNHIGPGASDAQCRWEKCPIRIITSRGNCFRV